MILQVWHQHHFTHLILPVSIIASLCVRMLSCLCYSRFGDLNTRLCSLGHINFSDEVSAGLRLADCVVLCVDAVDGIMLGAERVVRLAALERLPVFLMITKIDR